MAVGVMDAPDQLTEVKVCPQYNFLIFLSHPWISVAHFASPGVRLDAPVLIQQQVLLQLLIYYYVFIFPAYIKHCHIVPALRVSGLHILCSYQKLTFIFFAGVTGVFTLAIIRSKSYGEGLILKLIFFNKNQKPGKLLCTVWCISVLQVITTCLQLQLAPSD